ncbi:MAG TPA: stage III sporulation protein AF [Bacillota bacterium]|nr:stage III sporulation protein AF [Bacillota bacterium]
MDMLIQWVTQIVIFILLATIIDLLIPAHSMKKYVKFVVGLILILIVMQPIFYLFQTDIKQALEASVKDYLFDDQATEDMNDLIEMQKSEIQSTQHEYILKQMAVQLESIVEIPLMDSYQAEIVDIAYTFNQPTDYAYEDLEEVIVYLRELEDEEGRIDAVDDVVINTDEPIDVDHDEKTEAIIELLQEEWELEDKEITIVWEGGTS